MHEQSETELGGTGWLNVYGKGTKKAGQPLAPEFPFEQKQYSNVKEADQAAALRSMLHGYFEQTGQSPSQPQRLPQDIEQQLMILNQIRQGLR